MLMGSNALSGSFRTNSEELSVGGLDKVAGAMAEERHLLRVRVQGPSHRVDLEQVRLGARRFGAQVAECLDVQDLSQVILRFDALPIFET